MRLVFETNGDVRLGEIVLGHIIQTEEGFAMHLLDSGQPISADVSRAIADRLSECEKVASLPNRRDESEVRAGKLVEASSR